MTAKEWKDLYINWRYLWEANPTIPRSLRYKDLIESSSEVDAKVSYTIDIDGIRLLNGKYGLYIVLTIDLPDTLEHKAIFIVIRADGLNYGDKFISNDSDLADKYPELEGLGKKIQKILNKFQSKEETSMTETTKMTFVTLCGSHRFYDDFIRIKNDMEKDGNTHVFIPEIFQFVDPSKLDEKTHQRLDILHEAKMRQSDYVLIINKDGYIGEDTQKEINWCETYGIAVKYLETPKASVTLNGTSIKVTYPLDKDPDEFKRKLKESIKDMTLGWIEEELRLIGKSFPVTRYMLHDAGEIKLDIEVNEVIDDLLTPIWKEMEQDLNENT